VEVSKMRNNNGGEEEYLISKVKAEKRTEKMRE